MCRGSRCNPEYLMQCGVCCLLLSVWAVIQLIIMGIFYKLEATSLIDDVAEDTYEDYDDFIKKTKARFQITAINCWIAAVIYVVMGGLSVFCIVIARKKVKRAELESDDDELFCAPPDDPGQKLKNK